MIHKISIVIVDLVQHLFDLLISTMGSRGKLPKIADADREAQYGYVFGVSGPGEFKRSRSISFGERVSS
jgi:hypothetical protein